MGTNYYVKKPPTNRCDHCKREDPSEVIHIGKHSGGWKFGFSPKFGSWKEWYAFLLKNIDFIYDEYDHKIPFVDFVEMVEAAQNGIWIYDSRNPNGNEKYAAHQKYEYLDPGGYRIINSEDFC